MSKRKWRKFWRQDNHLDTVYMVLIPLVVYLCIMFISRQMFMAADLEFCNNLDPQTYIEMHCGVQ